MADVLLIDDDPALIPEQVRQAFPAPRYRVVVAATGAGVVLAALAVYSHAIFGSALTIGPGYRTVTYALAPQHGIVLILAYPIAFAGYLSLHTVSIRQLRSGELPFAGLANFVRLSEDPLFWLSLLAWSIGVNQRFDPSDSLTAQMPSLPRLASNQ